MTSQEKLESKGVMRGGDVFPAPGLCVARCYGCANTVLPTPWPRAEVAPRPTAEAAPMYDSALDLNENQGILDSFSFKMVPASPLEEINNHTP